MDQGYIKESEKLTTREKQQVVDRITSVIKSREEIIFAYLYGSFLESLPFRDIDIGVYLFKIDENKITSYCLDLMQELTKTIRLPIDVRPLNTAPVTFAFQVFKGELIFERDEEMRSKIMEQTLRKYLDIKPVILQGIKEAFAG